MQAAHDRLARIGGRVVWLSLRPSAPPFWLGVVVAAVMIAAETLVILSLKHFAAADAFGVVYLRGVLVVATGWGFGPAAATAIVSAIAYRFFRHWPAVAFNTRDVQNWIVIAVFLVVAFSANALADLARARATEADQRRREADLAADLAHLMLRTEELRSVLAPAAHRLAQALDVQWARLELEAFASDQHQWAVPLRDGGRWLAHS